MKKELKRNVSIMLCTTTLLLSNPFILTTFAAEANSVVATETEHKFVPSILQVSKIPEGNVYIPANTKINLELTKTIDSKNAKTGDPIQFKTLSNVIINDVVVIPTGTLANGVITKARSAGGMGRAGKLEFSIKSIETLNNVEVPLTYLSSKSGQSDGGAAAVFVAVSILGGLFMKGTNVQCVEGTKVEAVVPEDTDLKIPFTDLANAMSPTKPRGVVIQLPQ